MIRLLNSAMMPAEGTYRLERLTREQFVRAMRQAAKDGFCSYIGYPETARHIEALSGVPVPISRESTAIEDEDVLLVCKLSVRLRDTRAKSRLDLFQAETAGLGADAWEYFKCEFRKEKTSHEIPNG